MDTLMLKEISLSGDGPLTHIITSLSWKPAAVFPIFKGGDPLLTSIYRPISILPTVSKVYEKLVAKPITNHLNNSSFSLHPMQFGFRMNPHRNSHMLLCGRSRYQWTKERWWGLSPSTCVCRCGMVLIKIYECPHLYLFLKKD